MLLDSEWGGTWKAAVMLCFKVLFQQRSGQA